MTGLAFSALAEELETCGFLPFSVSVSRRAQAMKNSVEEQRTK
jgi:hypothetical protein